MGMKHHPVNGPLGACGCARRSRQQTTSCLAHQHPVGDAHRQLRMPHAAARSSRATGHTPHFSNAPVSDAVLSSLPQPQRSAKLRAGPGQLEKSADTCKSHMLPVPASTSSSTSTDNHYCYPHKASAAWHATHTRLNTHFPGGTKPFVP
jgi:hypothetical protein